MPALERNLDHAIEHDRWMVDPRHPDCLAHKDRWCRVCGRLDSEHGTVHSEKNGTAWAGADPIWLRAGEWLGPRASRYRESAPELR